MTLDIIVPHYKEPWETCKFLFDTLATQKGVYFGNIRVIVVNDGDCVLSNDCFGGYPYKVEYLKKQHGGVSAARNYGLDHATADYVMFCDIDDGFLNNYGLHLVFSAMQDGYDYISSNFVEETFTDNNTPSIVRHNNDFTFMHGKAYKRSFLTEHNLRFDPNMTIHEDGYFNTVALVTAKQEGKLKCIETPFYLWVWNDNSTVRSNREDFVLRTYGELMRTRIGACQQLKDRGYVEEFKTSVCMTVLNSYYDFQKTSYHVAKNQKHLRNAEKAFKGFWDLYGNVFKDCTNQMIAEVAVSARANACKNGMLMEQESLKAFVRRFE